MLYFQTKTTNLGKFWTVLQCLVLVYFLAIWYRYFVVMWYIFPRFGGFSMLNVDIFCGHLVYFMVICYIFPVLVCFTKKNLATPVETRLEAFEIGS
jgi:hypothetical protein